MVIGFLELKEPKNNQKTFFKNIIYRISVLWFRQFHERKGEKLDNNQLIGRERKCPICGGVFILGGENWAYKRVSGHKTMYFCSYGCLGKFEKTRPKKVAKGQREDMIRMLKEGKGISEIVRTLGVERSKVIYWKERVVSDDRT